MEEDLSALFSVDTKPDTGVKRRLAQKAGKASQRKLAREAVLAEREAQLAKLVFQDESLVDRLDVEKPVRSKAKKQRASRRTGRTFADSVEGLGEAADSEAEEGEEGKAGEDNVEDEDGDDDEEEEEAPRKKAPAWEDEDDAGLRVDVMKQMKLRKLRKAKAENVLSGAVYEERRRRRSKPADRVQAGRAECARRTVATGPC